MSHHPEPPKSLRELVGLLTKPIVELFDEPLPEQVGILHTTGSMCLFMIVHQIVTGVLMGFYYVPSPDVAWESVNYVDTQVSFGKFIHGLHHWGSSAFVVLAFIHMIRVFSYGAYKGHRKWTWMIGVLLLGVIMGFGFTGYLLPWDMKAYFGTQVGTNIVGKTPIVGSYVRRFLLGGEEISELTLPRFYALHVFVLPAALLGLAGIHLFLVRLFGITPPWKRDDEPVNYPYRFFPNQALRDASMSFLVLAALMILAGVAGGNLEEKADPFAQFYAPHPEWYFLGLQQLLRYFEGRAEIFGVFIIPALAFGVLLMLPFIDRNPERRLGKRPVALSLAGIVFVSIVALTVLGYSALREERAMFAEEAKKAEMHEGAGDEAVAPASEGIVATSSPRPNGLEFSDAEVQAGAHLYEALKCADCHALPEAGKELNIPPTLVYVGDRFTPQWMLKYLKEVPPRRYEAKARRAVIRMPDFKLTDSELRDVTAYMMSLKQPEHFARVLDPAKSTPERIAHGAELYDTESCHVCHALDGHGGKTAPDLTGAGDRLKPDFLFAMVKHPQALVPDTTMEDSFLEEAEIEDIAYYLLSLK